MARKRRGNISSAKEEESPSTSMRPVRECRKRAKTEATSLPTKEENKTGTVQSNNEDSSKRMIATPEKTRKSPKKKLELKSPRRRGGSGNALWKLKLKYETEKECETRYQKVVAQTMYVMGDAVEPYETNIETVFALTTDTLRYLLNGIDFQEEDSIKLLGGIFDHMKTRPDIIARLLKHTETMVKLRSIRSQEYDFFEKIGETYDELNIYQRASTFSNYFEEISAALQLSKVDYSLDELMEFSDPENERRMTALADRVRKMDPDDYPLLTEARKATFYTLATDLQNFKKSWIENKSFQKWIGVDDAPQVVIFVLSFVAKETVKQFTDFAMRVLKLKDEGLESENLSKQPIDPCVYKMAYFRNARVKNGNFMFGSIES